MKIFALALFLLAPVAHAETCYGGPGYYPYPCPPPSTPPICHGGPGNYPYPCPQR